MFDLRNQSTTTDQFQKKKMINLQIQGCKIFIIPLTPKYSAD